MGIGAIAGMVGGSLVGGLLAKDAAKDASKSSSKATKQIRSDLTPYRDIGQWGIGQYQNSLAQAHQPRFGFDLENDPIYQFARDEGLNASTRRMNALGYADSGNILDELRNRGNLFAAQYQDKAHGRQLGEYNMNYMQDQDLLDRYFNLGGMGQNAAAQTGVAGMQNAGNQAAADYYKAGSWNNAMQGGISNALTYDYLNKNPYQGYGSTLATSGSSPNSMLFSNGYPSLAMGG